MGRRATNCPMDKSLPLAMSDSGARGPLPAIFLGNGVMRYPRDNLQLYHEVRCRHQEGPVCKHCFVRRYHHVPRHCRPYAEGNHCPCTLSDEDQDHCPTREEVLSMDWRIYLGISFHLPTDVDQQAGI